MKSRAVPIEPEFATRFVHLPAEQNNGVSTLADPVELDGWVDSATVEGQPLFELVDGELAYRDPEPIVELCAGRTSDEAVLDLHASFSLQRVVVRRTGDVGSVLFDALQILAGKARVLERRLAQTSIRQQTAEAECTRLNEQLALERARQYGASSEQKLPAVAPPMRNTRRILSPHLCRPDANCAWLLRAAAENHWRTTSHVRTCRTIFHRPSESVRSAMCR